MGKMRRERERVGERRGNEEEGKKGMEEGEGRQTDT